MRFVLSSCTTIFAAAIACMQPVSSPAAPVYPVFTDDTVANTLSFNDTFGHTVVIGSYNPANGVWTTAGVAGGFTNITVSGNGTVAGTFGITGITTLGPVVINGAMSGSGFTAAFASPPPIGSTAPNTGAFTTLSATGALSGAAFNSLLSATPVGIGSVTPNGGAFTTLSASSTVSGSGFANYLLSPPAIGNSAPNTGAFTTLSAVAINSSGNHQITGGSLLNVDLQTVVPVNGSFLANAGASYQNCPLIGCLTGAHQFSAVYLKNTAAFDATKAEYMVTFDSNLNSGKSPQWVTATVYGAGAFVTNSGNLYSTVSGGTSGASAPTCGSGSCSDGGVLWVWQTTSFAAAKVGFFNSATTGANSSFQSWGMANDLIIGAGDTGNFKVGAEFDITNNSTDCAVGVKPCYNVTLGGITGNPVTAYFNIGTPVGNAAFGSHYAMIVAGTKVADTADLEMDDTAISAICISCLLPGKAHTYAIQDKSVATVGISLSGTYSGYAAIQTDAMTGTVAMTVKSGVGICMNGTVDCFSWNGSATNFDHALAVTGVTGLTCSGTPTSSFASTGGIVTHC